MPYVRWFVVELFYEYFSLLGLNCLLAHFSLKLILVNHPALKKLMAHAFSNLRRHDGVLAQCKIQSECFGNCEASKLMG